MPDNPQPDPFIFRVHSDEDGKIYLLYEPKNWRVEIEKPVSSASLEVASQQLLALGKTELDRELAKYEGDDKDVLSKQQLANREIKAVVYPPREGFFRLLKKVCESLFRGLFATFIVAMAITFLYKGVEYSRDHFPESIHLVVLLIYAIGLAGLVYLIATEETRRQKTDTIKTWFGQQGMLALPALILIVAASVFASITQSLYNHGWVMMEACAGRPVTEGTLRDFYMWHFLKLVPFLRLNETLKWNEPLCYSQGRVGFLILFFQALVVLPSINTIRYYWRNRAKLNARPYEYLYEPEWKPDVK